jgi:hypothetical protein
MTRLGSVTVLLFACLTLAGGCGQDRERREARAFLAVFDSMDHRQKAEDREQKLSQLRLLSLVEPAVVQARDHCVTGHTALLRSESAHEEAGRKLDEALLASPDKPLEPQASEQIRKQIEQAEKALNNARISLRQCEAQARSLSLRFGSNTK